MIGKRLMWFRCIKEEVGIVATNYRPISLNSELCKVFETIGLLSFWRLMYLLETPNMGLEKVVHV